MTEVEVHKKKIIIYGGNGFVGTHAAELLVNAGAQVICLSRNGYKPIYLKDTPWSTKARWCKGDASQPDTELLASADAVVCCVGSPPLPTFTEQSYQRQLFMNGTSCVNAIEGAKKAGCKKIILMNAQIPFPLKSKRFAYYQGKKMALQAAQAFADTSEQHTAIVLQPGMITGKRMLEHGKAIRLDWLTAPISWLMPWQFVSVNRVAQRICHAANNQQPYYGNCTVLRNRDI